MSDRVNDDREAARAQARLVEAKRAEEGQKQRKATESAAFAKLVGAQAEAAGAQARQKAGEQSAAKSAIAQLLESAHGQQAEAGAQAERTGRTLSEQARSTTQQAARGQAEQASTQGRALSAKGQEGRSSDAAAQLAEQQGRSADASGRAATLEGRRADARDGLERLEKKNESSLSTASSQGAAHGGAGEGKELRADADRGGGQQNQGQGNQGKPDPGAATVRFNPALMAPPPVAQRKDASGSERLRKVAAELAQKIVERVRVGTNAAGRMEFQVDLRSDVLKGLSVKVSAHNGKIKAVFTGSDRDVLKMVQEQGEVLKGALGARGLTLEELRIEARA